MNWDCICFRENGVGKLRIDPDCPHHGDGANGSVHAARTGQPLRRPTPVLTDVCVVASDHQVFSPDDDGHWDWRTSGKTSYTVWPIFAGVDRPEGVGIATTVKRNADRLVQALADGAALRNVTVLADFNGETYASYDHVVSGRYLNGDLKKLGY